MTRVIIYTDGACRGNPGPGGWGVVLQYGKNIKKLYGYEAHTTNNRMEMLAALRALEALKRACDVIINTDSNYLKQGITEWLPKWREKSAGKNMLRRADGKAVKNVDLWEQLSIQTERHNVCWQWIKGHADNPDNILADELANRAIDENDTKL